MSHTDSLHVPLKILFFSCCIFCFNTPWENVTWNLAKHMVYLDYKIPCNNIKLKPNFFKLIILCINMYAILSWELFVVPINLSSKPIQFLPISKYAIVLFPSFLNLHVFMFSNSIVVRENTRVCVHLHFSLTVWQCFPNRIMLHVPG